MEQTKLFFKYIIITFGLAWILQVAAIICSDKGIYTLLLAVSMFSPLAAVLILRQHKTVYWKPHTKRNILWYAVAWFTPTLFTAAGAALYFFVFSSLFDKNLTSLDSYIQLNPAVKFTAVQMFILQAV